ncbi:MAG: c-type cytochrome [Alphaproteobacteria bacterium]
MHIAKLGFLASNLRLAAALGLSIFGLGISPGMAIDGIRPELVPGLDLWTEQRQAAPYWQLEQAPPDLNSRAQRHREFLEGGVPLEYRSQTNPYPAATKFIREGSKLYKSHCQSCHDPNGLGDGEAGRDLTPSPALLAYMIDQRRSVDEYLLWTISDGGAQFGTEMPAFKDALKDQQIWQIVTYMRAGFP